MNNEMKKIYLSNLKWAKTHDNIGGVMGNLIFKDNMPYEEYEKLLKCGYFILCNKDYITNLQQENERLKEIWKDTNVIVKDDKTLVMNTNAYDTLEDYKSRCEKAIEYMQENYNELTDYGYKKEIYDDLLNILQGESNDK